MTTNKTSVKAGWDRCLFLMLPILILIISAFAVAHCLSKPLVVVIEDNLTCEKVEKPEDAQFSWKQDIEMTSEDQPTVLTPVDCDYYYADEPSCDWVEDPDKDYVIVLKFKDEIEPDKLKWTSSSWHVRTAFSKAHDSQLWGFGPNSREVRLCIGEKGGCAAGGIKKVIQNLKLVAL